MLIAGCGTIGIGSNKVVTIHNNSEDTIMATGEMGNIKIAPNSATSVESSENISLKSLNQKCDSPMIQRKPNSAAIVLDIVPGLFLGIIPIVVDAVTNNLYKLPSHYNYQCI